MATTRQRITQRATQALTGVGTKPIGDRTQDEIAAVIRKEAHSIDPAYLGSITELSMTRLVGKVQRSAEDATADEKEEQRANSGLPLKGNVTGAADGLGPVTPRTAPDDPISEIPFRSSEEWGPDAPDGIYLGVSNEAYHALGDAEEDAGRVWSRSMATPMLDCPARMKHKLDNPRPISGRGISVGSAFHMACLEPHRYPDDVIIKPDTCQGAYKSGKSCTASPKNAWRSTDGDITFRCGRHDPDTDLYEQVAVDAITESDKETVDTMRNRIFDSGIGSLHLSALDGFNEVSVLATVPTTDLRIRARPDIANFDDRGDAGITLVDLKTIRSDNRRSAHPSDIGREIMDRHYWLQDPWYCYAWNVALASALGGAEEVPPYLFASQFSYIFVENVAPHLVTSTHLDEKDARGAHKRMLDLFRDLDRCVRADQWPGYEWADYETPASLPAYAKRRYGI